MMVYWMVYAACVSAPASTLEEFIAASETHHADARIASFQSERSKAEYGSAWTGLLPSVMVQGGYAYNQYDVTTSFPAQDGSVKKMVMVPKNQLDAAVRVEMPLVDFTRWFRIQSTSAAKDASLARAQYTQDLSKRQVIGAYYSYGAAVSVREAAQASLALAKAQLALMEARIKAQSVTELELLRAQAELQRHVQNMADADAMVAMARHTLWTLTGLEVADTVALASDNTQQEVALDVFESYIEASPMVQAALFDAKVASAYMNTVRTATLPSLNAHFTERFTNATGFIGKESLYMAGLNLTWRLDIAAPYGVKAASAGVQAARMGVEKARRAVQEQVFQDWQRLDAARVKVQASALQKEAAMKAAKMARERYVVGVATQVDVIQAERDMFASEVACIQSRAELATARHGVRLSAGLPWNWQGPSS